MLPEQGVVTPGVANSPAGLAVCGNGNAKNLAILAGKDQELGELMKISNADTNLATLWGTTGNVGTGVASAGAALPSAYTGGNVNNNDDANDLFDIVAKTGSEWLIGATKLEALLKFGLAAVADWTDAQGILEICDNVAGATIPGTLDIHAGNVVTGAKCTAVYTFYPGAADPLYVTSAVNNNLIKQRQCRFCTTTFTSPNVINFIKDFVPPTTSTRKLSGMTVWAASAGGVSRIAGNSLSTATKQKAVAVPASGCGKAQTTKGGSTLGQSVEFTIKMPTPLCADQLVYWEDKTNPAKNW